MAHKVMMDLPPGNVEIKHADVKFKVRRDGKLFGTLEISKGSIVWYPAGKKFGRKMNWRKFSKMMEDNATRFETR